MKTIKVLGSTKEFEEFVNRTDIEIHQLDVRGCEQSYLFQESFIAVAYYSEKPDHNTLPNKDSPNMGTAKEILSKHLDLSGREYTNAELQIIQEAMIEFAENALDEAFHEIGAKVENGYLETKINLK